MTKSYGEADAEHQAEERENRFAHLLQPIRDLSANWNIDLAKELEAYLAELEGIKFSVDDNELLLSFNFSEAALLLQGSAAIYGRKVEHLHALVFQALALFQRRSEEEGEGQEDGGNGADERRPKRGESRDGGGGEEEDFAMFMSSGELDMAASKDINLGTSLDDQMETSRSAAAASGRMPEILLAIEEDVQPGANGTGVFSAEIASYKTKACGMHRSGALLLHLRDGDHLGVDLCPITDASAARAGTDGGGKAVSPDRAQRASSKTDGLHGDVPMEQHPGPAAAAGREEAPVDGNCDADDVAGLNDMDFGGSSPMQCEDFGYDNRACQSGNPAELPTPNRCRQQEAERNGPEEEEEEEEEEEFEDPWEALDPYDPGDPSLQKPIKTWERGSRWKRMTEPRRPKGAGGALKKEPFPLASPNSPLYQDFLGVLHKIKLLQSRDKKGDSSRHGRSRSAAPNAFEDPQHDPVGVFAAAAAAAAEDNDVGNGWDCNEHLDGDYGGGISDCEMGNGDVEGQKEGNPGASGSGKNADGTEGMVFDGLGENADCQNLYEDLCRAQIDEMLKSAAAAEVQSELAARVAEWKTKIEPALEVQDARPEFDIHAYGERLLDRLEVATATQGIAASQQKSNGKKSSFSNLVSGFKKYDVSRSFAAMLQLVNNGNIKLELEGNSLPFCFTASNTFSVRLLNTRKPHQEMLRRQALSPTAAAAGKSIPCSKGKDAASRPTQGPFRQPTTASHATKSARNAARQPARAGVAEGPGVTPVEPEVLDGCLTQERHGPTTPVQQGTKRQKKARTPEPSTTVSRSRLPCGDINSVRRVAVPIRTHLTRAAAASPSTPEWARLGRVAAGGARKLEEYVNRERKRQAGPTSSPQRDVENTPRSPGRREARNAAKVGQRMQQDAAVSKQTPDGKKRRKSQRAAGREALHVIK
ncbi:hypothetical protein CBR_g38039 [Chara braunii]|uniref:Condensin-2 complex subunit H2 n=1 Tax=Chara braunii TaxID=69332 RepID=A0A388K060_CHABU|nr:hypothetical protein CBR_g38039 [Chara braunii]|eukprot:GBG63417.1 hypothetical protein CBR_g38039 [Chara braunii]